MLDQVISTNQPPPTLGTRMIGAKRRQMICGSSELA